MTDKTAVSILVVDDQEANICLLSDLLSFRGYRVYTAANGDAALAAIDRHRPDVVLLDVVMPGLSGLDVCRNLRANPRYAMLPIILVTALDPDTERVKGLDAGANDFLSKPINESELFARVRSLVRLKQLFDRTETQAARLRELNDQLQNIVAEKVDEIGRLSRLRRFVSPQLAQRIVAGGAHDPLVSHRRDIAVVFFDLRGFTAFSDSAAPEDVISLLNEYHELVGTETRRFGGTIERFTGDGIMIFFNDPEPISDPCGVAAQFTLAVMDACKVLLARWRRNGFEIDVGSGIAYGYATLGAIGFADRLDYGAIGMVTNLAARLCGEAKGGQILVATRVAAAIQERFAMAPAGPFSLKGLRDPVNAFELGAAARD